MDSLSRTTLLVVCLAVCLATPRFAAAQRTTAQRSPVYSPQRPTISPYFGLFQYNTTGLPNYYAFVRPRQDLLSDLSRQANRVERLELRSGERATAGGPGLLREPNLGGGTTSRAATYLNLDPYYPLQRSIRTRR